MELDGREILWKALASGAAVLAAILARKVLVSGWRGARHAEPPTNPADPTTSWGEAVTWAALTGALVGVARMLAQRGAAQSWNRVTGDLPPGLKEVA